MRTGIYNPAILLFSSSPALVFASVIFSRGVDVARSLIDRGSNTLFHIARSSAASSAQDASRLAARDYPTPLNNPAYLPAQIGGIIGAYALCLVLVAFTLLALSKRRREHLESGEEFEYYQAVVFNPLPQTLQLQDSIVPYAAKTPAQANFYPGPVSPVSNNPYFSASYASSFRVPGVDPEVDQEIVSADREMAQSQLEEMYKYVMEQEEAKAAGIVLEDPPPPISPVSNSGRNNIPNGSNAARPQVASPYAAANIGHQTQPSNSSTSTLLRKEKNKPMALNLGGNSNKEERTSRTASILSALKSPLGKKNKVQGMSISSPIMTPMSGTFPRGAEGEEMNAIAPRYYAPPAPPPVPAEHIQQMQLKQMQREMEAQVQAAQNQQQQQNQRVPGAPLTPDTSPMSTLSIDERIGASIVTSNLQNLHNRNASTVTSNTAPTEAEPESAVSEHSMAPLVGLPTSPKPGVNRFPSLPASPRDGRFPGSGAPLSPRNPSASFQASPLSPRSTTGNFPQSPGAPLKSPGIPGGFVRANAPTALRTGGALPLRAYEPSITSPRFATHGQTKQTVFERTMPQSPGAQTPWTGAPVPYSPYQPFSPVVPITPSLVTKADRKRMKRMEPKTPTMEMVKSIDETW